MLRIDALASQSKGNAFFPKTRIATTLVILIASLIFNRVEVFGALIISASFLIFLLSPIKLKHFMMLVLIPLSFIALSVVIIAFQISMREALITLIRSLSSLLLIYSLTLTLPMHHFTHFMKAIRLPSAFIELYELCYRFIFILIEEASDMILAQQMRFGFYSIKQVGKSLNLTLSILFFRAFSRFKDLENAMALRFE